MREADEAKNRKDPTELEEGVELMRTKDALEPTRVEEVMELVAPEGATEPTRIEGVMESMAPEGREEEVTGGSPFFLGHFLPGPGARSGFATPGGSSSTRRGGLPLVIGPEVFNTASEVLQALHDTYKA